MNIYIASPFFNAQERDTVQNIERACNETGCSYYSPMREGVILKDLSPEDRKKFAAKTYSENVIAIAGSNIVLAMIDNFDPGTMFEIGYAAALGVPVITYSPAGYGVNVMIAEASKAHYTDINELKRDLRNREFKGSKLETVE